MKMRVNGCCCFDLKAGVLVIGIMLLIGQIMIIPTPYNGNEYVCNNKFYMMNCEDSISKNNSERIILNIIISIVIIMMIYGSLKSEPTFMIPVLILSIITMMLYLGLIWTESIKSITKGQTEAGGATLIFGHAVLAFMFYFFMVIYSHYKELKNNQMSIYSIKNDLLYSEKSFQFEKNPV